MLSDKKPPKTRLRKFYTDSQKLEAVKLWLIVGNIPVVSASLNIPLPTLKQWRYLKWWEDISKELRSEDRLKLSSKLKNIAEKALDITLDRLENGDVFYDQKLAKVVRKEISLRDAASVADMVLDKNLKLDDQPQQVDQQKTQDRLEALAEAFTNLSKKAYKVEVLDIIPDSPKAINLCTSDSP
jgi:hypothetical protein